MYAWDTTTFELTEARLALKPGLGFSVQRSRHGDWYMVEDEARGTFFRLGAAEYTFMSFLDGRTTMATAMARTCSIMGASALDENEAIRLCQWMVETGLASTDASVSSGRIQEQKDRLARQKAIQRINPVSIRIPIWNPDRLVEQVTRLTGWMFSWPFAMVWMFMASYALISVCMDWQRLIQGSGQVFTRNGVIWMAATWILLKLVHELAHAVACKKLGGKTGHFGILLLLLIPLPYVDVTSSWRFTSKHHRILVAAAGMMAEIFLASIAALIWCYSGTGALSFYASNVIFAASLHTLLFNANPLLKFDGYHMLADWLEIPNLGSHGQRYVMGQFKKIFFGLPSEDVKYAGIHAAVIKIYGFAALLWRISLCLVLGIAAANLFQGIGLLIAMVGCVLWLGVPIYKFIAFLAGDQSIEHEHRIRFFRNTGLVTAIATVALLVVPAPSVITAPAVVEYRDLNVIRNESSGFVKSITVRRDQQIAAGDLLMVLENPELTTRRIGIQLQLEEARVRANAHRSTGDIASWQLENESVAALQQQLSDVARLENELKIRSPISGRVISDNLQDMVGNYVSAGTELLSIGNENEKSAIALIAQDDAKFLGDLDGKAVSVRVWGHSRAEPAEIVNIEPQGQDDLPHFAFAGMYGGPLDVANRQQLESAEDPSDSDLGHLMLVSARVKARVRFNPESSQRLHAGQTGVIHLRNRTGSIGSYLFKNFRRWFVRNLKLGHGI